MRVTCPNCGSKFKVPDKALGTTGRKLKCGKCEHKWFQKPEADAPAAARAAVRRVLRPGAEAHELHLPARLTKVWGKEAR